MGKMFWCRQIWQQLQQTTVINLSTSAILPDKQTLLTLYNSKGEATVITEVEPARLTDFRYLSFEDNSFYQIIFDPPHLIHAEDNAWLKTKYGRFNQENWKTDIRAGFSEAWRGLKLNGTLIFKWNDSDISIAKLKPFFPSQPIIG